MRGCAGAVNGAITERDGGSVSSLPGKSVGEMNGLVSCVSYLSREKYLLYLRPVQTRHLRETIHDLVSARPRDICRIVLGLSRQVSRGSVEDEIAESRRETIPIKHDSIEQLPECEWLQHPTAEPPRPFFLDLAVLLPSPDHATILCHIPAELKGAEHGVDRYRHPKLLRRVNAERQTGERGAHRGCIWRG